MLHNLLTVLRPLDKIVMWMMVGAIVVLVAAILLSKSGRSVRWPHVWTAIAIALSMTAIGLALNFFTYPESPPALPDSHPAFWLISAVTMPGVLAMNIFGRRSLEDAFFFGGFVLNIVLLSSCAYALLRRFRRA